MPLPDAHSFSTYMAQGVLTMKTTKILALLLTLTLAGAVAAAEAPTPAATPAPAPSATSVNSFETTAVKCPVTGEDVQVTKDTVHSTYKGKDYYFCCASCKGQFDKDPEKYLQGK